MDCWDIIIPIVTWVLGFLSSIALWYFTTVKLKPEVVIDNNIIKEKHADGRTIYKLIIKNLSKKRNAYSIQIYFRILYNNHYINMVLPELPVLLCAENAINNNDTEREVPIDLLHIRKSKLIDCGDKKIIYKFEKKTLVIEDFYDVNSRFDVILIAYDAFSGACCRTISNSYTSEQIKKSIQQKRTASES